MSMGMDWFFYWGDMPLDDEVAADVQALLMQPQGELYYDRSYGAGVPEIENASSQLMAQVGGRFAAVQAIAVRNDRVSDGTNGPDRRVATSQATVSVEELKDGGYEIEVLYVPLGGTRRARKVLAPIGGVA